MPTKQKCLICDELKVLKDFPPAQKVHGVQRYKHTCIACIELKESLRNVVDQKTIEDAQMEAAIVEIEEQDDFNVGFKVCKVCGIEKPNSEFFKDRVSNGRQTYRGDCKQCSQTAAKTRISRYRSKKKHLVSTLTKEEWQEALTFFNGHCAYCLTGLAECQEHVKPVDKGGSYAADNIVPACLKCNSSKGNRNLKFWWKQQTFFEQSSLDLVNIWLESKKIPEIIE